MATRGAYHEVRRHCEEMLAMSPDSVDWRVALGLAMFLDEQEPEVQYTSPDVFAAAARSTDATAEAHFWYGYSELILFNDTVEARRGLAAVLTACPDHAYAHLVLGGIEGGDRRLWHLRQVRRFQPGNLLGLKRLAQELYELGLEDEAVAVRRQMTSTPIHVEVTQFLANVYVNEVLVGAPLEAELRDWANEHP